MSNPVDAPARDLWAFSGSGAYDGQAGVVSAAGSKWAGPIAPSNMAPIA
jgi:hypothetical protein